MSSWSRNALTIRLAGVSRKVAAQSGHQAGLPVHPEADVAVQAVAAAEVLQAGPRQRLAVERVFAVGEAHRATKAEATPQRIVLADQIDPGHVDMRAIQEVVIEVGDA